MGSHSERLRIRLDHLPRCLCPPCQPAFLGVNVILFLLGLQGTHGRCGCPWSPGKWIPRRGVILGGPALALPDLEPLGPAGQASAWSPERGRKQHPSLSLVFLDISPGGQTLTDHRSDQIGLRSGVVTVVCAPCKLCDGGLADTGAFLQVPEQTCGKHRAILDDCFLIL